MPVQLFNPLWHDVPELAVVWCLKCTSAKSKFISSVTEAESSNTAQWITRTHLAPLVRDRLRSCNPIRIKRFGKWMNEWILNPLFKLALVGLMDFGHSMFLVHLTLWHSSSSSYLYFSILPIIKKWLSFLYSTSFVCYSFFFGCYWESSIPRPLNNMFSIFSKCNNGFIQLNFFIQPMASKQPPDL